MSLSRSDVVQLLTLWFAVLVFLQTGSGGSGAFFTVAAFVAVALLWVVPLYLFVEAVLYLFVETPVLRAQ